MPIPLLARAKRTLLALEKLGEYAPVRGGFQDGSRLGEYRTSLGPVAQRRPDLREGQQPEKGGPGAQAGQPSSRRKSALQLLLGFVQFPALREHASGCDGRQSSLGDIMQPEPAHQCARLSRVRLGLL